MGERAIQVEPLAAGTRGLRYWSAGVRGRDRMDPAAFAAFLAEPRSLEASRRTVKATLAFQQSDPKMVRMLQDVTRLFYAIFVLYLDARGPLTLTAIGEFCRELNLASPGRAAAILINLRMIGYIAPSPVQADRRQRRYVPTAQMRDLFHRAFRQQLEAYALVEPAFQRVADRIHQPVVFRELILHLGNGMANMVRRKQTSAVSLFDSRNAGLGILYWICESGADGDYPPKQPVHVSVKALADEFKVSRSHVLKMLRDGQAAGYLHRDADLSTVTILEPLREALLEFHAVSFMGMATASCAALEAIGERP